MRRCSVLPVAPRLSISKEHCHGVFGSSAALTGAILWCSSLRTPHITSTAPSRASRHSGAPYHSALPLQNSRTLSWLVRALTPSHQLHPLITQHGYCGIGASFAACATVIPYHCALPQPHIGACANSKSWAGVFDSNCPQKCDCMLRTSCSIDLATC